MQGEAEGEDVGFMNLGIDRVVTYIYIYVYILDIAEALSLMWISYMWCKLHAKYTNLHTSSQLCALCLVATNWSTIHSREAG